MATKTKSKLRLFKFSNVFFLFFMYFQFSKKIVDQIFKCNIVLIERYISKCILTNIIFVIPQGLKSIGNMGTAFPGREQFDRKEGASSMRNQEDTWSFEE